MNEDKIIELLRKHDGNAAAVDKELGEYLGYTYFHWIKRSDRVRSEYDRLKHEGRNNEISC